MNSRLRDLLHDVVSYGLTFTLDQDGNGYKYLLKDSHGSCLALGTGYSVNQASITEHIETVFLVWLSQESDPYPEDS